MPLHAIVLVRLSLPFWQVTSRITHAHSEQMLIEAQRYLLRMHSGKSISILPMNVFFCVCDQQFSRVQMSAVVFV